MMALKLNHFISSSSLSLAPLIRHRLVERARLPPLRVVSPLAQRHLLRRQRAAPVRVKEVERFPNLLDFLLAEAGPLNGLVSPASRGSARHLR